MEDEIYQIYKKFINADMLDLADWGMYIESALDTKKILLEEVEELITKNEPGKISEHYKITTKSGREYIAKFTYYSDAFDFFYKKELSANQKNADISTEVYSKLKQNSRNTDLVCMIMFEDSDKNTNITNNIGHQAYEIFAGVQTAGTQSINKYLDRISTFYIRVSNNEQKRIKLYQLIMKKQLKAYQYNHIDNDTEAKEGNIILLFSKNPI